MTAGVVDERCCRVMEEVCRPLGGMGEVAAQLTCSHLRRRRDRLVEQRLELGGAQRAASGTAGNVERRTWVAVRQRPAELVNRR